MSAPSSYVSSSALRARYTRFIGFKPADSCCTGLSFPYTALKNYEKTRVAAGKPHIFVTATYEGKKRPVYEATSLRLDAYRRPTTSSSYWEQAVNVQDSGFINFWVTQYVRPILMKQMGTSNLCFMLDNSEFSWPAWGVLNDNNEFVGGIPWDSPFPTSADAYLSSVASFFTQLKNSYPDVKPMPNTGNMSDPSKYPTVFANVAGVLLEDDYYWHSKPSSYNLNIWNSLVLPLYSYIAQHGKQAIVGAVVPENNRGALITAFVFYELVKGSHFFFAPKIAGTDYAVPFSQWEGMRAKLGSPLSAYTSKLLGSGSYARLFSRSYSGGYVYLNWTGRTQYVTLPSGTWLNPSGNRVTTISVPNLTGTYVTKS